MDAAIAADDCIVPLPYTLYVVLFVPLAIVEATCEFQQVDEDLQQCDAAHAQKEAHVSGDPTQQIHGLYPLLLCLFQASGVLP